MRTGSCRRGTLRRFGTRRAKISCVLTTTNSARNRVCFSNDSPFKKLTSRRTSARAGLGIPIAAVSTLYRGRRLRPPCLVGLSARNFRIPVFRKTGRTLGRTDLLIMRACGFGVTPNDLQFPRVYRCLRSQKFHYVSVDRPVCHSCSHTF